MATPYISGVFAKLWEIHPEKTSAELTQYFKDNCIERVPIGSTSSHLWCQKNKCPDPITHARVNVELPGCLEGVIVGCTESGDICDDVAIAEEYGVPIEQVEFVGQTTPSGISMVAIEAIKFRIVGTVNGQPVTAAEIGAASIDTTLSPTRAPLPDGATYEPTVRPTSKPTTEAEADAEEEASALGPIIGGVLGGVVVLVLFYYWYTSSGSTRGNAATIVGHNYNPVNTNRPLAR